MNRKFLGIVIATLLVLGVVGQSQANVVTTIGGWNGAPNRQISDQDKLYTLSETNIDDDVRVEFETFVFATNDVHTVTVGGLTSGSDYVLDYFIEITSPVFRFLDISIDTDVPATSPDVQVSKEVYSVDGALLFTIDSVSGSPAGPKLLPIFATKLFIRDIFKVDTLNPSQDGILRSTTNTFRQTIVPEPASIVSFGGLALLMGVVMMRRRKRA